MWWAISRSPNVVKKKMIHTKLVVEFIFISMKCSSKIWNYSPGFSFLANLSSVITSFRMFTFKWRNKKTNIDFFKNVEYYCKHCLLSSLAKRIATIAWSILVYSIYGQKAEKVQKKSEKNQKKIRKKSEKFRKKIKKKCRKKCEKKRRTS